MSAPDRDVPQDPEEIRADIIEARTEVAQTVDQLTERLNPTNQARQVAERVVASAKRSSARSVAAARHHVQRLQPTAKGVLIGSERARPLLPIIATAGLGSAVIVVVVRRRRGRR